MTAVTNGQPFLSPFNEFVSRRSRFRELHCNSPFAVRAIRNSRNARWHWCCQSLLEVASIMLQGMGINGHMPLQCLVALEASMGHTVAILWPSVLKSVVKSPNGANSRDCTRSYRVNSAHNCTTNHDQHIFITPEPMDVMLNTIHLHMWPYTWPRNSRTSSSQVLRVLRNVKPPNAIFCA